MKIAALVSGGKDSLYAAYLAKADISYIISVISENPESYMFHVPNAALVEKQAQAMGIPLIQKTTKGEKEAELEDLKAAISEAHVDAIVGGAVASVYQKERLEKLCNELGIKLIAPMWHKDPESLLRQMLADGFEIIITAVGAPPLDEKWLGRKIDSAMINELVELNKKHGIHIMGEGGEFETFVLNCPLFKKKLNITDSEKMWEEKTKSGWIKIDVELLDK